jgi:hypothetical protein
VGYGYRRLVVLLKREGCELNAKRIYRAGDVLCTTSLPTITGSEIAVVSSTRLIDPATALAINPISGAGLSISHRRRLRWTGSPCSNR